MFAIVFWSTCSIDPSGNEPGCLNHLYKIAGKFFLYVKTVDSLRNKLSCGVLGLCKLSLEPSELLTWFNFNQLNCFVATGRANVLCICLPLTNVTFMDHSIGSLC